MHQKDRRIQLAPCRQHADERLSSQALVSEQLGYERYAKVRFRSSEQRGEVPGRERSGDGHLCQLPLPVLEPPAVGSRAVLEGERWNGRELCRGFERMSPREAGTRDEDPFHVADLASHEPLI